MLTKVPLAGLVLYGTWGSVSLAWRHALTGEACPVIGFVPACYVAAAGYLAMTVGILLVKQVAWARRAFFGGLVVAGGLALLGSLLELVQGHVCPRVGAVPMCYLSLAASIAIGVLYLRSFGAAGRG